MDYEEKLTDDFKWGEFWSNSASGKKIEPPFSLKENIIMVAKELQKIRDEIGKPIRINSGWRTEEWNKAVGGSKTSYHLKGLAADIRVYIPQKELLVYIGRFTEFKGIGISSSFIHVDLRNKLIFWYY